MKRRILSMLLGVVLSITTVLSSLPASTLSVEAAGELDTYVTDNSNLSTEEVTAPPKDHTLPSANQYKYQKDELAAFCHFGPNTYMNEEWGYKNGKWLYEGKSTDEIFRLKNKFQADSYVKALKDAGFKKVIVTAKHHDGFCIWQSDYTTYDIASTEYGRNGGDILAEISAACSKYGLDMGLYLSPWDVAESTFGADGGTKDNAYNDYYDHQLEEILSQDKYGRDGHFVEVWMDGANGYGDKKPQTYDFDRWFATIQKWEGTTDGRYDSDCMLFGAGANLTVRWIGNEEGHAADTTWSKSKVLPDSFNGTPHIYNDPSQNNDSTSAGYYKGDPTDGYSNGYETGNQWTVPEADAKITSGWFWGSDASKQTPLSLETLKEMYYRSVGNGATLLLNVPPNTDGTVDQAILDRLEEFGYNIQETFRDNLAARDDATIYASSVYKNNAAYKPGNVVDGDDATYWTVDENTKQGSIIVKWDTPQKFDVVSIEEAIQNGQRINNYKVEYKANDNADWQTLGSGVTIGPKRLVRFAPISATQVKITVGIGNYPLQSEKTTSVPTDGRPEEDINPRIPMLSEIGIYKATEKFATGVAVPEGMDMISCNDSRITYSASSGNKGWHPQTGSTYINGNNTYSDLAGASFEFEFTGSKIYLMGTKDPNHGSADILIDENEVETINTRATDRSTGTLIFESADLQHGTHRIKLKAKTADAIGFEAAYIINNGGRGLLEFEKDTYTTNEGCDVAVKVKRVGGFTGELKATIASDVGTAIQRHFDTGHSVELTFAEGETEKYIPKAALTSRTTEADGTVYFYVKLMGDQVTGFTDSARVNIKDAERITAESFDAFVEECEAYERSLYRGDWAAFEAALESAQALKGNPDEGLLEQKKLAYIALDEAVMSLTLRDKYTSEDPFMFPTEVNQSVVLEAEMGEIDNNTSGDDNYPAKVTDSNWSSNGKFVNALNNNDKLKIPYYASEAGTYEFKITYRSGSVNNGLLWVSDPAGNITAGTVTAGAASAADTHTATFTMTVAKAGEGVLIFNGAATYGAPQTDKFDVKLVKATVSFDALKELIAGIDVTQYEGKKTPASIQDLKDAIAEGKALYADETAEAAATQTKVNSAKEAIEAALDDLMDIVDKSTLSAKIQEAEMIDTSRYTEDSVKALKDAIEAAKVVAGDDNATTEEVKNVSDALASAVEGLKVPEVYEVLEGKNETYTTSQDGTFTLRASGTIDKFVSVKVDGKIVDPKYYTIKSGSTIVTFTKEYMEYLSTGKHTIDVVFTDGVATTSLTVAEKVSDHPAPPTGTNTGNSSNNSSSTGNSSNGSSSAGRPSTAGTATGTGAKTGDPAEITMMMALCLAAAVLAVFARTERRKVR